MNQRFTAKELRSCTSAVRSALDPAKIIDRFTLGGTDGPLEHVKLSCRSGLHWFTPLAEDVEVMQVAPSAEQLDALPARRAAA